MEDFVIKKVRVEVELYPVFRDNMKGFLFLSEMSRYHQGRESLFEYMNSNEEFIAFKTKEDISFFNKDSIKMIKIINKEEEQALYTNFVEKEEDCIIIFTDGKEIECKIRFDPNTYHNRIYDFLHHSQKFINAIMNDELILINKNCIVQIILKG